MDSGSNGQHRFAPAAKAVALYLLLWTGLAVLFSGQYLLESAYDGRGVMFAPAIRGATLFAGAWAMIAWPLFALGARYPFRGPDALPRLVFFVFAGLSGAGIQIFLRLVMARTLGWEPERTLWELASSHLYINAVVALTIGFVSQISASYRRSREQERRERELELTAAHAESELAKAQLQLLRQQLHPHFLFNTLNAISALMHQDVAAADRTLGQLSDLLRQALDTSGLREWTLQEEAALVSRYLEIQQVRFRERLATCITVDEDAKRVAVPPFVLQPLVENAIEHAVAHRRAGGRIDVRASVREGQLVIEVEDDGPEEPGTRPTPAKTGIGLVNTTARLARLYGTTASLRVTRKVSGGAIATMAIPARQM